MVLRKCHSESFAFVTLSETKGLGIEILRFVQNDKQERSSE